MTKDWFEPDLFYSRTPLFFSLSHYFASVSARAAYRKSACQKVETLQSSQASACLLALDEATGKLRCKNIFISLAR